MREWHIGCNDGDKLGMSELEPRVNALCAKILQAPPPASTGVKEYLRRAMQMDTTSAVDFARNIHAVINSSSEMKGGKRDGH